MERVGRLGIMNVHVDISLKVKTDLGCVGSSTTTTVSRRLPCRAGGFTSPRLHKDTPPSIKAYSFNICFNLDAIGAPKLPQPI